MFTEVFQNYFQVNTTSKFSQEPNPSWSSYAMRKTLTDSSLEIALAAVLRQKSKSSVRYSRIH